MIIEVAKKGVMAHAALTTTILAVVSATAYLISTVLNGYVFVGTYGALVVPSLLAALWTLWSLRRLIRYSYARMPLIFAANGHLNYVAPGHATVRLSDVECYAIKGDTFPRLHLYGASNLELRRYPLFLSSSSSAEVANGLTAIGLNQCAEAQYCK